MTTGITQLLTVDHQKIKDIYSQLKKMRSQTSFNIEECDQLFTEFKALVVSQSKAENMALYSLFSDADEKEEKELKSHSLEGYEKHQIFSRLLDEMASLEIFDNQWLAKLEVVTELLEQHVNEEETEYFPQVRDVLEPEELEDLGALYVQQQKEIYNLEKGDSSRF
jgi:hypothetical protein